MSTPKSPSVETPLWFGERTFATGFRNAEMQWLARRHKDFATMHVSETNMQRYSHGRHWSTLSDRDEPPDEIMTHETAATISLVDIQKNDLEAWIRVLLDIAGAMQSQFFGMLIATLNDSTDKSGNSVSAKALGSNAAAFLELLSRIEFGVDRDGAVSLPQMLVAPETGKKWLADLESQPPEFKEKVDSLIEEKSRLALEREEERRSKFKRADD